MISTGLKRSSVWAVALAAAFAVAFTGDVALGAKAVGTSAVGRDSGLSVDEIAPPIQRPGAKAGKLESRLTQITEIASAAGAAQAAQARGLVLAGTEVRVVVDARADRAAAATAVRAAGGRIEREAGGLVQAFVPIDALQALSKQPSVRYIRAPFPHEADAVAGEEVGASYAGAFQGYGWTGTGAKVAVVDLGFNGLPERQAAGEVPSSAVSVNYCGTGFTDGTEHGTAVAEIVAEEAPNAQLYLICVDSEVGLAQAKDYAKANGIKIVTHSVSWFNTARGDGTGGAGTPDAIVADARANGILWLNSTGNYATAHWSGAFSDPNGDLWHNFTATDLGNSFFLPAGADTCAFLKWNDWGGSGSGNDYDLYIVRSSDNVIVGGSENVQNGTQPPTETACYVNPDPSQYFYVAIRKFQATAAPRFDLWLAGPSLEYQVAATSLTEPSSSPNTMAVGALCWRDGSLEPFSSIGPTIDGRTKPEIAGLDGNSSATYGSTSPGPGCTAGFLGTSAATPQIAGLAALLLGQNPSLTGPQLQSVLAARAADIAPAGKDNRTGAGRGYVYTFTDVTPWAPLASYVEQFFQDGRTTGCLPLNPTTGVRNYCPIDNVTRRDMAVFIVRAEGLTPLISPTPTFADVPASMFGYGEVERFYEQGITTGCFFDPGPPEVRRYCPLDFVTRRDMAVFIVRAKGLTPLISPTPTFTDVPASMFGYGHVERFYEQGITTGCFYDPGPPSVRRFCPVDRVTRREMATFLTRAFP